MFENSYKIRVSARAIVFYEDNVLLNCFGDGLYYNIPGGGVEEGENARMAAVREVREETDLPVEAGEFVFSLEYEPVTANYAYGDGHHISFVFRCRLLGGHTLSAPELPDVDPENPANVSRPVWLPIARLPEIELMPHVNENLAAYFKTGVFRPVFFEDPYK
ncbi:MAG: NUDIX domain-containing protein [Defluviitaleaceae bacterium]|nr:NUDIX domain-containing protein [Defluviitaleaceae bacterium]